MAQEEAMQLTDLIAKRRQGDTLTAAELKFFIDQLSAKDVDDAQIGAFLDTYAFTDITDMTELTDFTMALAYSGGIYDLSDIPGIKLDKQATAALGDKTSLILLPLIASLGIPVAKLSQPGLAGLPSTLDRLAAIPGFKTTLSPNEFVSQVRETGLAIAAPVAELDPADQKLRQLRVRTGTFTVPSLLASSMMSQKIATGADALTFDIKTGVGQQLLPPELAETVAKTLVQLGDSVGRQTVAMVSHMVQPLGQGIGASLEVAEAIKTLRGQGPADLQEMVMTLGTIMARQGGYAGSDDQIQAALIGKLENGQALDKFKEMIGLQGGDERVIDAPELLPQPAFMSDLRAVGEGYVTNFDLSRLQQVVVALGGSGADADPAVGILLHKKLGEAVAPGEALATIYGQSDDLQPMAELAQQAITVGAEPVEVAPLIEKVVTVSDIEEA